MKRIMLANNKDKDQKFVDENYEASIKELTWHLAKNHLLEQCEVKIEDADVKEVAKEMTRMQFAQYGMSNIPEEYIEQYSEEMLKKPESGFTWLSLFSFHTIAFTTYHPLGNYVQ